MTQLWQRHLTIPWEVLCSLPNWGKVIGSWYLLSRGHNLGWSTSLSWGSSLSEGRFWERTVMSPPQQPTLVNVQSVPHRSHMYWPGFSNMAVPWFSSYVNLGESFRPLRLSHRILKVQWGLLLSKLPGIQVMLINVAIISSWSSMKIINWALCLELCTHISDHWLTSYSWLCHGFFKLHSRILNSLSTPSSGYGLRERG